MTASPAALDEIDFMVGDNGWSEWREHVLDSLGDLGKAQKRIEDKLGVLAVEVAVLKYKAGVWGALAGLIPVTLYFAYRAMEK